MTLSRRGFVAGLAGILVANKAPAFVREPMKIWVPKQEVEVFGRHIELFTLHDSIHYGNVTGKVLGFDKNKMYWVAVEYNRVPEFFIPYWPT